MKIFARRVEAPEPHKPYATKWQIAVGDAADDPCLRYFDRVQIEGLAVVQIVEENNPAVYIVPGPLTTVIGVKDSLAARLQ